MVAQAQVKQVTQFVFPPGKPVVELKVDNGTIFTAGMIPDHVTELDMQMSSPVFECGAIPPTLLYLNVKDLVKGSIYPDTVSLFVRDYTGKVPIPTGPKVFINIDEKDKVSRDSEHYIFIYRGILAPAHQQSPDYDHGPAISKRIFDCTIGYAKRTPKAKVQEPTPAPVIDAHTEDQAKLVQAQLGLIEIKKKLAQAKLELIEEKLKVARGIGKQVML